MKQPVFYLLCSAFLLLVCAPLSKNESIDRRDGNWWREQTTEKKTTYMTGFFDGMELGRNFAYWGIIEKDKNDPAMAKVRSSYEEYSKYLINVSNVQLAEGVDTFYSDYRNRQILVHDAVWLVLNQIAGKSDMEMQSMIESWRQNAAQR
jgi:hypothetical protein